MSSHIATASKLIHAPARKFTTSFIVESTNDDHQARVTISTTLKGRNMVEVWIAKNILQKVYLQELELLAQLAEGHAQAVRTPPV